VVASDWALWLAVIGSGIYHGVSPGMGWPLAVSAGLMERRQGALFAALGSMAIGHFLATALMILPFAVLVTLVAWQASIQAAAGIGVMGFGLFLLCNRRHARLLARIRPTQLVLWSFAVAIAHGAGLMLLPIYLGLCRAPALDQGHEAAGALMGSDLGMAFVVVAVHAAAVVVAGGASAFACYRWLGLRFISRSWFNLETVWAASLVAVGALGLLAGLVSFGAGAV
jgi:hypothetical protein